MTRITIAATSDLHAHWRPGPGGGISGVAAVLAGADRERAVIIDTGDLLTGSLLGAHQTFLRTQAGSEHPLLTATLDALGADAAVPGNHDFDDGLDALVGAVAVLRRTRYLCANAIGDDGEPVFAPSAEFERDGVRIGVIGAVTAHVQRLSRHEGLERVRFTDPVGAVVAEARRVRPRVDLLVVAYHGGFERDPATGEPFDYDRGENQAAALLDVPGVDGLIAGHTHTARAGVVERADGGRVAYAQPGYAGSHVGVLTFEVEAGAVRAVGAEAVAVGGSVAGMLRGELAGAAGAAYASPDSAAALARLETLHEAAEAWLDSPCPLSDDDLHAAVAARTGSRRTALGLPEHPRTWRSLLEHFPPPYGAADYLVPRREYEAALRAAGTAAAPRIHIVDHEGPGAGEDSGPWVALTANPTFGAHLHASRIQRIHLHASRIQRIHLVDWFDEFARVAREHGAGKAAGDDV